MDDSSEAVKDKFRVARKLKTLYDEIYEDYKRNLTSDDHKQTALALYFLDKLGVRLGEPIRDEWDASEGAGVVTLLGYMVDILDEHKVWLHFPLPANRWFCAVLDLEPAAWEALCSIHPTCSQDRVFSSISFQSIGSHLENYDPELKAEHLRYFNASRDFQEQLKYWTSEGPKYKKRNAYSVAVQCVARDCNLHREDESIRTAEQLEKFIAEIEKKKKRLKEVQINLQKAVKEKNEEEINSLIHDVHIVRLELELNHLMSSLKRGEFLDCYIRTSNYLDPRITVAWCKRWNVPISAIFDRIATEYYQWALETGEDFEY